MSFPNRVTRSQIGPRFRNVYPVENPETDIGEKQFNDLFDQVAGMNVVVARGSLVAKHNGGGVFDVFHQAEAWNPDGAQLHPVLAVDPDVTAGSPGRYIYTFAASYLDGDGNSIATALPSVRVSTFGVPASNATPHTSRVQQMAWVDPANPLIVRIAIFNAALAYVDVPFWLEIL